MGNNFLEDRQLTEINIVEALEISLGSVYFKYKVLGFKKLRLLTIERKTL